MFLLCRRSTNKFAFTRQASVLLEQIAVSVKNCEPVLLVGETGTGKTATVQFLAQETGVVFSDMVTQVFNLLI